MHVALSLVEFGLSSSRMSHKIIYNLSNVLCLVYGNIELYYISRQSERPACQRSNNYSAYVYLTTIYTTECMVTTTTIVGRVTGLSLVIEPMCLTVADLEGAEPGSPPLWATD